MTKRGRPPKPWSEEIKQDIERAAQLRDESGPFGLKWPAFVSGEIGEDLCSLYNEQRVHLPPSAKIKEGYKTWWNRLPLFGYLFEGLSLLTENFALPEHERRDAKIFWMDPHYDAAGQEIPGEKRSGEFTLWGPSVPKLLLAGLARPNDGSVHELSPFGTPPLPEFDPDSGLTKEKLRQQFVTFVTVSKGDIDGTIRRMQSDVTISSAAYPEKYIAARGPGRKGSRRIPPVVYFGKRERLELRATVTIACYTTAAVIKWFEWMGLPRDEAAEKWWHILEGIYLRSLITAFDKNKQQDGRFGADFRRLHGEDAAAEFAASAWCGGALAGWWSLKAGPARARHDPPDFPFFRGSSADQVDRLEFLAICKLGAYLFSRNMGLCMYYPKCGTIRVCRIDGCTSAAFVWRPKAKDFKNQPRKGKPQPSDYCPECTRLELKAAARQKRYDRRRRKRSH